MGWVKLDDAFLDHPKYLAAGPLAGYLCICSIAWSNRNRTDGRIPLRQVRRLVDFEGFAHHVWQNEMFGGGDDVEAMQLAEELVAIGLWDRTDDGFYIHDYHDWQRTSEEIEDSLEQRREAGKRSAAKRKANASSDSSFNGSSNDSFNEN